MPMPLWKLHSKRVSSYFPLAGSGVLASQRSGDMALTEEDLLSSLRTFMVALREELMADFKSALEALQSDVTSRMTCLQADVDSVGTFGERGLTA
ncbi:hypothetical protein NDU88_005077 [Pleurodeles waltl]|uniref:Uncharacterized protein n=1 Tax=Pleurodeles waltl TaxID=8319 RepID=A0AAV7QDP4_PLEWA|nr:hypothetical protein NDU88_005077 [Pleurodeles waltl]